MKKLRHRELKYFVESDVRDRIRSRNQLFNHCVPCLSVNEDIDLNNCNAINFFFNKE